MNTCLWINTRAVLTVCTLLSLCGPSDAHPLPQQAKVQADSDGDGVPDAKDHYPSIADFNLLTWEIHSLQVGWKVETESRVQKQTSLTWTVGESEVKIEGDKSTVDFNIGGESEGKVGGSLNANPLRLFGLAGFSASLEARAKAGLSFQKEMEWGSKRQQETRRAAESFAKFSAATRISDPFFSVWITFRNHSTDDLFLRPTGIPVFAAGKTVCSASVVERDGPEGLLLPANRPNGVEVEFRALLDTTTAQQLLLGLGTSAPSVDLAKSRIVIRKEDGTGDAISAAQRVEDRTVEISVSSGDVRWSWRVATQDALNPRPLTLRMALEAINERLSREFGAEHIALFAIENSKLAQIAATPIKSSDGIWSTTVGGVNVVEGRAPELDQPLRIGAPVAFTFRSTSERCRAAEDAIRAKDPEGIASAVETLRELAESGFAPAQKSYGNCFHEGVGRAVDDSEAVRWWSKAAEQGCAKGQHNLAVAYANGLGVPKNYEQAITWSRKSAEQGNADAQCNLGGAYANGLGVPKNIEQAITWFRKSAEQGNADAQCQLGVRYIAGIGVPKDDVQAVGWIRKAAEQGYAPGQSTLGDMYMSGIGVPKDDAQAVVWCRKAAEQGYAPGQSSLGAMYMNGIGVPKDDAQAVVWCRKAAEQGFVLGQANLGVLYMEGRGVPRDDAQAIAWFRKAAEQENAHAQHNLGFMYATARGVPKDDAQAIAWYRKAAEQGHAPGQSSLGKMCLEGRGVPRDDAQAIAWFRKAAEQGDPTAQRMLGAMYELGRGVPRNRVQSLLWLSLFAAQSDESAKRGLEELLQDSTPQQIAEAERLVREFRPKVNP